MRCEHINEHPTKNGVLYWLSMCILFVKIHKVHSEMSEFGNENDERYGLYTNEGEEIIIIIN